MKVGARLVGDGEASLDLDVEVDVDGEVDVEVDVLARKFYVDVEKAMERRVLEN